VPDPALDGRRGSAEEVSRARRGTSAAGAAPAGADPPVRRRRLTFRRLSGLDRSGPPPSQTAAGQPLRPWTIPNAIGFVRLALIPVFLAVALSDSGSPSVLAAVLFAVVGWGDYADGIAARVTGQYSRLGALMDPVTDRLLAISGVVVCWHFQLLPRWALAVLIARELAMLALGRYGLARGVELRINWPGRLSVAPLMGAFFFAMLGLEGFGAVLLYVGLALALAASVLYVRAGRRQARAAQRG
jgi:phosphatidylglycerophosphate synthase